MNEFSHEVTADERDIGDARVQAVVARRHAMMSDPLFTQVIHGPDEEAGALVLPPNPRICRHRHADMTR